MELPEWCMTFFNLIIAPKKGSIYEDWAQKGKDKEREREREGKVEERCEEEGDDE